MKSIYILFFVSLSFVACKNNTPSVSIEENTENESDGTIQNSFSLQFKTASRLSLVEDFFERFNKQQDNFGQNNRPFQLLGVMDSVFLVQSGRENPTAFIKEVIQNNTKLNFTDNDWYALAKVKAQYQSKDTALTITLKFQMNKDTTFQWVVVGMDAPFLNLSNDNKEKDIIKPNAHNLDFNRLTDALNAIEIKGTSFNGFNIDRLSIAYYLIKKQDLILKDIQSVDFHFLQVPNWYFIVKRIDVLSSKSGWLIGELKRMKNEEKDKILKNNMGISNPSFYSLKK